MPRQHKKPAALEFSPVSRLHDDILWTIFMENTESYHDERLETARHTSQVCQRWRRIILRSSSLWGRLIDLDECKTHDWMREVMSRAGDAFLWITCFSQSSRGEAIPEFILSFISEKWTNIQRLKICDPILTSSTPYCEEMDPKQYWTALLRRPAPNLQGFLFYYHSDVSKDDVDPSSNWLLPTPLFSSAAPALEKFEVYRLSMSDDMLNFTMYIPRPWFSNLRSFTLRQCISYQRLLEILDTIPLLEDLEIRGSFILTTSPDHSISMVNLPKLISLRLEDWDFSSTATFLDSILPSPGCNLSMSPPSDMDMDNKDHHQVSQEQTVITRYMRAYFEHHQPTDISLCPGEQFVHIEYSDRQCNSSLSVWAYQSLAREVFVTSFFSTIVKIELCIDYDLDPSESFALLKQMEPTQGQMFPSLHTIKLGSWRAKLHPLCRELLHSFLQHRRDTGPLPISVLDLSALRPCNLLCDLDNLEEFTGLLVMWSSSSQSRKKYICGSGHPGDLCFKEERTRRGYLFGGKTTRPWVKRRKSGWAGHL